MSLILESSVSPLDGNSLARIVLDVREQCVKPRLMRADSALAFFADAWLVQLYAVSAPTAPISNHPLFLLRNRRRLKSDRLAVEPSTLDFPQFVGTRGMQAVTLWGELRLPVGLDSEEPRKLGLLPTMETDQTLAALAMHLLRSAPGASVVQRDVRLSPHRDRIHGLLGARISPSYFETALRYGYDVRRFYGAEHAERVLVLCPYCNAPIDPGEPTCPTCRRDTREDACWEGTAREVAEWDRKPCRACATPILATALVCPGCRAEQRE